MEPKDSLLRSQQLAASVHAESTYQGSWFLRNDFKQ
jgi:hypothetical protein